MAEAGRDLQRSCGPTTLLRQGHLDPTAQDHVQMASEYLQWWRESLWLPPTETVPTYLEAP